MARLQSWTADIRTEVRIHSSQEFLLFIIILFNISILLCLPARIGQCSLYIRYGGSISDEDHRHAVSHQLYSDLETVGYTMARSLMTTDLMSNFIPTTPKTEAHALPADNLNPSDLTSDVSLGLLTVGLLS